MSRSSHSRSVAAEKSLVPPASARSAALLMLLAAFFLRVWGVGQWELWFDEAASVFIARKPLSEIVRYVVVSRYEHPPVYYVLLHFWMGLTGENEFAVRSLSIIFGMLFVVALRWLGGRTGGAPLGLAAIAVGTVAPFAVEHAREARMYSLVMLLGLILIGATMNVLAGRRSALLVLSLTAVVGVATSYFFVPLVLAADLVLLWHRPAIVRRWWLWLLGLHLLGAAIMAGWLMIASGPRETLLHFVGMADPVTAWPEKLAPAFGDIATERVEDFPLNVSVVAIIWGFVLLGAARWRAVQPPAPLLPFFLASLSLAWILPVMIGRYLSTVVGGVYLLLALGIVWLRQRWPRVAWAALPLLLWSIVLPLWQYYSSDNGYFGAAFAAATSKLRGPHDALILSQPDTWPQVDFYGRRQPVAPTIFYFPERHDQQRIVQSEVTERMGAILRDFDRVVLGPIGAWNRDPDFLLEHYLLDHGFAVSREFWPDSTMVALFVGPRPLRPGPSGLDFAERTRVRSSQLSSLRVPAGGEIATRLIWEPLTDDLPRLFVSLQLQDESGLVWAVQQTEPCNGWCASPTWQPGMIITDNRALLIPADAPPGRYSLLLRLDTPDGPFGEPRRLGEVEVIPGMPTPPRTPPQATLAGVEVRAASIAPTVLRPGDEFSWSVQWRPAAGAPEDWQVAWELLDDNGVRQRWQVPPSRADFLPRQWGSNQAVRGQGRLNLPGDLPPRRYVLRLRLIAPDGVSLSDVLPVATLEVVDRPRRFDLPQLGQSLDAAWAQGVRLRAVALPQTAAPGDMVPVTLVWQAGGPTDRSYKVFVHLRDGANQVVAQDDRLPAGGSALTNSWAPGEVVVDEHRLDLPSDLPAGRYAVVVGLYRDEDGARLPLAAGGDEYRVATLEVTAP